LSASPFRKRVERDRVPSQKEVTDHLAIDSKGRHPGPISSTLLMAVKRLKESKAECEDDKIVFSQTTAGASKGTVQGTEGGLRVIATVHQTSRVCVSPLAALGPASLTLFEFCTALLEGRDDVPETFGVARALYSDKRLTSALAAVANDAAHRAPSTLCKARQAGVALRHLVATFPAALRDGAWSTQTWTVTMAIFAGARLRRPGSWPWPPEWKKLSHAPAPYGTLRVCAHCSKV
jgi:hypothetical protein